MAQKTVQKSVLVKVVERAIAAIYLHRPPTLSHTQRPHSPTVPVPFTARGLAAAGPGLLASIGLLADTVHDRRREKSTG